MLFLGAQSFLLEFRAAKTAGKPPSPPSLSQVPHTPTAACGGTGNERVREGRPAETGGSCRPVRNFLTSIEKKMTAEKPKKKSPNDFLERDPRATADRCQALGVAKGTNHDFTESFLYLHTLLPFGKVFASI